MKKIKEMQRFQQILFIVLIATAVIAFWRGVWGLMDTYILPNNYILSCWITLIAGLLLLIITRYASKTLI